MSRLTTPAQTPHPAHNTTATRQGPRVIDPADFKFISGGSPRGGWTVATTAPVLQSSSPRGGW